MKTLRLNNAWAGKPANNMIKYHEDLLYVIDSEITSRLSTETKCRRFGPDEQSEARSAPQIQIFTVKNRKVFFIRS